MQMLLQSGKHAIGRDPIGWLSGNIRYPGNARCANNRTMIQFFRNILLYGGGDFVVRGLSVLMVALLARSVPGSEFGIFVAVTAATGLFGLAIGFGGETTYTRYYYADEFVDARSSLTVSWISWLAAIGALSLLALFIWREAVGNMLTGGPNNSFAIALGLSAVPLVAISMLLGQILRIRDQPALFIGLSAGTALLSAILGASAVLLLRQGVEGYFAAVVIATLALIPIRLWVVRDLLRGRPSITVVKQMVPMGLGIALAGIGPMTLSFSDRLLVGRFLGLEQLGHYGIAGTIGSVLAFGAIAIAQAWQPAILKQWQEAPGKAAAMAARATTLLCLVLATAALGLISFADLLVAILGGGAYADAASAVPGLAVGAAAYGLISISTLGLLLKKKSGRLALLSGCAALVGILANLVLIPRYGIVGASWGNALGFTCFILFTGIASQKVWPLAFEKRRIAGIALLFLAFAAISGRNTVNHAILDALISVLLIIAFLAAGILVAGVDTRNVWAITKSEK